MTFCESAYSWTSAAGFGEMSGTEPCTSAADFGDTYGTEPCTSSAFECWGRLDMETCTSSSGVGDTFDWSGCFCSDTFFFWIIDFFLLFGGGGGDVSDTLEYVLNNCSGGLVEKSSKSSCSFGCTNGIDVEWACSTWAISKASISSTVGTMFEHAFWMYHKQIR